MNYNEQYVAVVSMRSPTTTPDGLGGEFTDLLIDLQTMQVLERVHNFDGTVKETVYDYNTFDPMPYGIHGRIFMDRVEEMISVENFGS